MKTQLQQVCTFSAGVPNSKYEKATNADQAVAYLVNGSAIGSLGELVMQELQPITEKEDQSINKYILEEGDVLLLSKGSSIRAALVTNEFANKRLLAGAALTVIQPKKDKLYGELLVTFFNSEEGQSTIASLQKGSVVLNLSLKDLRELELSVPSLEVQNEIKALFHVSTEAYQDAIAVAEQQKKAATSVMLKLMKGEEQ